MEWDQPLAEAAGNMFRSQGIISAAAWFFVACLYLFVLEIFFVLFVCGSLCSLLENNEIVVCFCSSGYRWSLRPYKYKVLPLSFHHFSSMKNELPLSTPKRSTNKNTNFFRMQFSIIRHMTQRSQWTWFCLCLCVFYWRDGHKSKACWTPELHHDNQNLSQPSCPSGDRFIPGQRKSHHPNLPDLQSRPWPFPNPVFCSFWKEEVPLGTILCSHCALCHKNRMVSS